MIYLARVDGGVVVLDLGWLGAERRLERGLARLGATPADVVAVFLTHGHRDHIGAWRAVRHAPLHMAAAEVEPFLGRARYRGLVPRLAERLRRTPRPAGGEVRAVGFARDTAFALGSDTLRAFLLAGHTRGSAAYLFRRVLFVGDALARPPLLGFRPAPAAFADEPHRAAASLESLWARVAPYRVDHVCTAHGKCAAFTERFRRKVSRAPRGPGG